MRVLKEVSERQREKEKCINIKKHKSNKKKKLPN